MKKNNISLLKYKLSFLLLFVVISSLLHFKSYNQYPTSTHAWAQSDHYAIALGFLDNGFDFFHPKTFSLNHQFPSEIKLTNPQGITAVDFPIIHYLASLGMKIFKTNKPWVFRLVSLIWSFIALYFLFVTITRLKGFWEAIIIIFFIMLIPIYSYYQNSFMPSVAAFNSLLVGIAFLLHYNYLATKKAFYFGFFFLTLAALMRFTQVIFLIALTSVYFLELLKNKKLSYQFMLSFLGLIVVGAYFYYNKLLTAKYGSVFLNKPVIADSFSKLIQHLAHQILRYVREFITFFHLSILIILILLYKKQSLKRSILSPIWIYWIIISSIGVIIFNLLMSYHMSGHDYYALDTWIPLLSLLFIYLVFQVDFSIYKPLTPILAVIITAGSLTLSVEKQFFKYKYIYGDPDKVIVDFSKSSSFLDENTSDSQKLLVICASGWNTPMIGWNKEVYRVAWKFKEQIPEALSQDYDLIITHNASFEERVLNNMPDFKDWVVKVKDNQWVTIWRPIGK